ncbi:MAG: hypothetical protein GXP54_04870, partial [Deltaproteobacteria bacterium]|nr:hypothetical protein [Deltaproteobacteria bacterium]
ETYVLRLFLSVLPSLAFLLLFGRFLRGFVPDRRGWILVMLGLAAGSMFFTYGLLLYGHQQAGLSLFGAFMAFFANRRRARDSAVLLAAGGLLLGLAVSCEYQSVFSATVIGLYGLSVMRRRVIGVLWVAAGAVGPMVLTMIYHKEAFGSVFATGHDFLENATYRGYQKHGYKGMFVYSWKGLFGTLLSPRNGLFFYSPWLAFFAPGLYAMFRRPELRREALCVGFAVLAYVAFICGMFAWKGGWSVGPRYLDAIVPFMAFGVAVFLGSPEGRRGLPRALLAALLVPSVLMYGLSTAWYPHFPEDISNPFFEFILPLIGTGRVPWTLGGFLGLKGIAAMLPFLSVLVMFVSAIVWAGASRPDRRTPPPGRATAAILIVVMSIAGMWALSGPRTDNPATVKAGLDLAKKVWEPKPPPEKTSIPLRPGLRSATGGRRSSGHPR